MSQQNMSRLLDHLNWVARRGGRFALVALRFPGVVEILTLVYLFRKYDDKWCQYYCGVNEKMYPRAWVVWVVFLATIPTFATAMLVWLIGSAAVMWLVERRGQRWKKTRRDAGDDAGYMLLREEEGGYNSPPPSPTTATPRRTWISHFPSIYTLTWVIRVAAYTVLVFYADYHYKHYENPQDIRFRPALQHALAQKSPDRAGYAKGEKIFIAASFFNNEDVLPYWTQTMLDVITYLGRDNVFVSIVESNSADRSPDLLRDFDRKLDGLSVQRRILVKDDAVPKPSDMSWNNRIDFLAAVRNRAMEPLVEHGGYDRVLFSNDIYVEPESVIELLETADGAYDMACGLDFAHFGAYDMWVLRDRIGHLASGIWPYFFDAADYTAMKEGAPVPVFTCWNGITVFAADPLVPVHLRTNRTLSTSPLQRPPPPTHPLANTVRDSPAVTPPLSFRSSPRGEGCFSSESFLLPYDMRRIMGLERIYVNPRVIAGYTWKFYVWFKWILRHPFVQWFVEEMYDGAWMQYARTIVGEESEVYTWDGGDCHPWWYGGWW